MLLSGNFILYCSYTLFFAAASTHAVVNEQTRVVYIANCSVAIIRNCCDIEFDLVEILQFVIFLGMDGTRMVIQTEQGLSKIVPIYFNLTKNEHK